MQEKLMKKGMIITRGKRKISLELALLILEFLDDIGRYLMNDHLVIKQNYSNRGKFLQVMSWTQWITEDVFIDSTCKYLPSIANNCTATCVLIVDSF